MENKSINIVTEIKNSKIVDNINKVTLLGKGGFSDCYLIQTKDKSYVIKFRRDKETWRLKRELKLLSIKKIVKNKLAPIIYKFDKSCKNFKFPYLLEEYVQGKNPRKTKIDSWFIKTMAKEYKELHSVSSPKTEKPDMKRIDSIDHWIKEHYIEFKKRKNSLEKNTRNDLKILYNKLLKICKENDTILKRRVYNLVQCDPSKENIFIMKNKDIKLIDWDFAGYHLFERDLILFSDIYNLNKKQERSFLKHYGIKINNAFMKKFCILKLLLFAGDINWLLSQKEINHKKIKSILKKCFRILRHLENNLDIDI
ncbi:phosphotransferase [Candidatus Pacearchaeota archaeon]|nr:phosphotransferase [Candidatus Pacearchaeota archaeon]